MDEKPVANEPSSEIDSGDIKSQLSMKAHHLEAMSVVAQEGLGNVSDELRDDYMWAMNTLSTEIVQLNMAA